MARRKGTPMYGPKTINGSHFFTKAADRIVKAAERRTGKSASDLLEHAARVVLPTLTKAETDAIVATRAET